MGLPRPGPGGGAPRRQQQPPPLCRRGGTQPPACPRRGLYNSALSERDCKRHFGRDQLSADELATSLGNDTGTHYDRCGDCVERHGFSGDARLHTWTSLHWADDLEVAVPHMAVMTKPEASASRRSGRMSSCGTQPPTCTFRVYGDAAVVSGRLQRTRSMNGKELFRRLAIQQGHIRQGQQWVSSPSTPPTLLSPDLLY